MNGSNLKLFGQRLRQLRKARGLSQTDLVDILYGIYAVNLPNGNLHLDSSRISKWEHAEKSRSVPKRQQMLMLLQCFAEQLTAKTAALWAKQAGYTFTSSELGNIFLLSATPVPERRILSTSTNSRIMLGEIPNTRGFVGRLDELAILDNWITNEQCRLVMVTGQGGIGKTSIAAKLTMQIAKNFECVFWLSMINTPPFEESIDRILTFFSDTLTTELHSYTSDKIATVIEYFQHHRCLVIFDNVESIFEHNTHAGKFQVEYQEYEQLFQRVGCGIHQSCLLLTGREIPQSLVPVIGGKSTVRSLTLKGVSVETCRMLLNDRILVGDTAAWNSLVQRFGGSPLALRQVATTIQDIFSGDITAYLTEIPAGFNEIQQLLTDQLNRLPSLEMDILFWLTINREPTSFAQIYADMVPPISRDTLLSSLVSLHHRCLVEQNAGLFFLQSVIVDYTTHQLVEQVSQEIISGRISLLQKFPLVKAQAKSFIRESQSRLLLAPVGRNLLNAMGIDELTPVLSRILSSLRQSSVPQPGYAAGNILNIVLHLNIDANLFDFSKLNVWQAYLRGANLIDVNFSYANLSTSVFSESFGGILSLSFSPNSILLAAGTTNNKVILWKVANNKRLCTMDEHTGWVWSVDFSPDGNLLATGSQDRTVRIWNVQSGKLLRTLDAHDEWVTCVTFNHRGNLLASSSADRTIRLWDVKTGQCIKTLTGYPDWVLSVAFNNDDTLLASGGADGSIWLWDVFSGQHLRTLVGHTDWVKSVAFNPNNNLLVSGSHDTTIKLWQATNGTLLKTFIGHDNWIMSVVFNSDGTFLVSSSDDRTVRMWDINNSKSSRILTEHTARVWTAAVSPNEQLIASGSDDSTIHIWDISKKHNTMTIQGYFDTTWSVQWLLSGKDLLISGHGDHSIRVWDTKLEQEIRTLHLHDNRVRAVAMCSDKHTIASAGDDHLVQIWNIHTGKILHTLSGHTNRVAATAFSPDGGLIASGSFDHTIKIWHTHTGQLLITLNGHANWIRSVIFSPNGMLLASVGNDHIIKLWDTQTWQFRTIITSHRQHIWAIAFSPDGRSIASASEDGTIQLWQVESGIRTHIFNNIGDRIMSVAFSSDGEWLAEGGYNGLIRLWDLKTGACQKTFSGHTGSIVTIAFNRDGTQLASGSFDSTIRLWNLHTGECLKTFRPLPPYARMDITGVSGLSFAQRSNLKLLGAIERTHINTDF